MCSLEIVSRTNRVYVTVKVLVGTDRPRVKFELKTENSLEVLNLN
jgi:hypothetical protein